MAAVMKSTPDLCDEYPTLVRVVDPMFINFGGRHEFCGRAVTVKCFEDNSRIKELVATPGEGRVIVVDAGGSMRCACLGDMLAESAALNDWSGFIINGCIRDVDEIAITAIGVQALGVHPLKTHKQGVGEVDLAVTFGGVTFSPGDYIYADNNGILASSQPLN
jgi:regulator of ribonuclease activity A